MTYSRIGKSCRRCIDPKQKIQTLLPIEPADEQKIDEGLVERAGGEVRTPSGAATRRCGRPRTFPGAIP